MNYFIFFIIIKELQHNKINYSSPLKHTNIRPSRDHCAKVVATLHFFLSGEKSINFTILFIRIYVVLWCSLGHDWKGFHSMDRGMDECCCIQSPPICLASPPVSTINSLTNPWKSIITITSFAPIFLDFLLPSLTFHNDEYAVGLVTQL